RRFRGDRATVRGALRLDGLPALLKHLEDTTGVDNLTYSLAFLARVHAGGVLGGAPFRVTALSSSLSFVAPPAEPELAPPPRAAASAPRRWRRPPSSPTATTG